MPTSIVLTPRGTIETRRNLFNNPSGRRPTTGYVLVGSGGIGQDLGQDTYAQANANIGAVSFGLLIESTTVAAKLIAGATYTFSATVYGSATRAGVFIFGAGVASGGAVSYAPPAAFARVSTTFVASAAGAVNFYVVNGDPVVNGNIIAFRDAMLEVGNIVGTYIDGSLPAAGETSYAWTGPVDNSPSIQRLVDPGTLLAPELILGYETVRKSRNIVHEILSSPVPVITLHEALPRAGTLSLLFLTEPAALNALSVLSRVGTFTLADTARPSVNMTFAVTPGQVTFTLDEDTHNAWTLTVPYQELTS